MFKTTSYTCSSTIFQWSINTADKDEFVKNKIGGNKTNLSNSSMSKKSAKQII